MKWHLLHHKTYVTMQHFHPVSFITKLRQMAATASYFGSCKLKLQQISLIYPSVLYINFDDLGGSIWRKITSKFCARFLFPSSEVYIGPNTNVFGWLPEQYKEKSLNHLRHSYVNFLVVSVFLQLTAAKQHEKAKWNYIYKVCNNSYMNRFTAKIEGTKDYLQ
jgi:hypothetical protein